MTRGLTPDVASRHALVDTLPAMLQEDEFLRRFTAALDDVLTPLFTTLDCLDSYVDPRVAPMDFLDWVAGWVGLELDPRWSQEVRRRVTCSAAELHEARGTTGGLRDELAMLTGGAVEVDEPGGVTWSAVAGGCLPPATAHRVVVRVRGGDPDLADPAGPARRRLDAAARAVVPAHLPVTVEVLS
jgi:phage tail-like protein